ncbi:hypothetical protein [Nostoc sp. MG11]|uniref:hypothetical protein n=1 Tax=Nostoc sp. MG11 TaxID=2721166 RepID=UPI00186816B6|nr:hypothetical protein [Nostoc sp. MG11]
MQNIDSEYLANSDCKSSPNTCRFNQQDLSQEDINRIHWCDRCQIYSLIPIQLMIATNPLVETLQCNVSTMIYLSHYFFLIGIT